MPIFVSAFLIGIIAGLRAMMAPTMICWAACCGWLNLEGTPLHFFSSAITRWLFSFAAIGELVNDKLPEDPEPQSSSTVHRSHRHRRALRSGHRRCPPVPRPRTHRRSGGRSCGNLRRGSASWLALQHHRQAPSRRTHRGCNRHLRGSADRLASMTPTHFDAIIVGAGQAGPSLAGRLTAAGRKVAIIERKLFGGTCVNTGCTPTKTLVASAYVAHKARTADGVRQSTFAGPITVDMKAVKARKDEDRHEVAQRHSKPGCDGMKNCTVFTGHARFESPTEIRVGDDLLTATADLPQRRRPRHRARTSPAFDDDSLPQQRRAFSNSMTLPRHLISRRRQLHRPRIRADLPSLRQRSHHHRNRPPASSHAKTRTSPHRSKTFLEKEGITVRLNAECIHLARLTETT